MDVLKINVGARLRVLVGQAQSTAGEYALTLLAASRQIEKFLPRDLFADPARNILLDLFSSEEAGRIMTIGDAALVSGVPPSTALRCVELLKSQGLVVTRPDSDDRRRVILNLTEQGHAAIFAYLSAVSPTPL